jgi:hypothetical protein
LRPQWAQLAWIFDNLPTRNKKLLQIRESRKMRAGRSRYVQVLKEHGLGGPLMKKTRYNFRFVTQPAQMGFTPNPGEWGTLRDVIYLDEAGPAPTHADFRRLPQVARDEQAARLRAQRAARGQLLNDLYGDVARNALNHLFHP